MCGPFKSPQAILRLLEIILSTVALVMVLFRGAMLSPWGVWCEFVWLFCVLVPLFLLVMEAMRWNVLLAPFLPDWADLCCGLTMLCAAMIVSATVAFGAVFLCLACVANIVCFALSLAAAVVFLVDAVMQKLKCPAGYLSRLRGLLRMSEAFVACLAIAAAADFLWQLPWSAPRVVMICCVLAFTACLLVTMVIILLHLLKLLKALLAFALGLMEFAFNIAAALVYALAIALWIAFGYPFYTYDSNTCESCLHADFIAVAVGAFVNLVLYLLDLVLSFKSR